MTGTLTLRYRRGTPLGGLHAEAHIDRVDGIKTYAVGHIADAEGVTVEAEGVFILPKWARKAVAGEPGYEDFYLIFPDRELPDAYERTTREIFPDDHAGSFVRLPDGRWIWATFYRFQWDLNYAAPAVFRAMAGEMLFLANRGVEVLRMDAVAFIWKQLGTTCESLPEAHLLLQAFNAVLRMAAPGLLFKSEAIVHPDEVISYISPDECQISYNPLQMALTWEALATRDGRLLITAPEENAIRVRVGNGPITTWVQDRRLRWPDSMAEGPDGSIYVTASRIKDNDWFKPDGKPGVSTQLFRIRP